MRIATLQFAFISVALLIVAVTYVFTPAPLLDRAYLTLPAACVLLGAVIIGLGTLQVRWPRVRRFALQLGLTVPLLVAAAGAVRAARATHEATTHAEALAEFRSTAPPAEQADEMRRVFFNVYKQMHDHDYVFVRNMLWALTAWCVIGFVTLQLVRARAMWRRRS